MGESGFKATVLKCMIKNLKKGFVGDYGDYLGEGDGTPLQYSWLENPMDGGAWKAAVHWVTEGQTRLSDFPFMG